MLEMPQHEFEPGGLSNIKIKSIFMKESFEKIIPILSKLQQNPTIEVKEALHQIMELKLQLDANIADFAKGNQDLEEKVLEYRQILEKMIKAVEAFKLHIAIPELTFLDPILSMLDSALQYSQFLEQPSGIREIQWHVQWRLNQAKESEELNILLKEINKEIKSYQEGSIEQIENIIEKINFFLLKNPTAIKKEPWLLGVREECQIMQKKHQALTIRHRLDEINIDLMGKQNTADLEHTRALNAISKKYKINTKAATQKKPTTFWGKIVYGIKSAFSFFNIAKDIRQENYLKAKQKINDNHKKNLAQILKKHKDTYGIEIKQLEENFRNLKVDPLHDPQLLRAVIMPMSFQSHRNIKELAALNGGMMIGGLSQSQVISLGSSSGLCYGFTKEWVLMMNGFQGKNLNEVTMIDAINLYNKKSENQKSYYSNQVNNLELNDSVYKSFSEQTKDRRQAREVFANNVNIDKEFTKHMFSAFEQGQMQSLIISIQSKSGGGHALGAVQNKLGIWFHDSNSGCFYFPYHQSTEDTKNRFKSFFDDYMKQNYSDYVQGSFVPIQAKKSSQKSFTTSFDKLQDTQEAIPVESPQSTVITPTIRQKNKF